MAAPAFGTTLAMVAPYLPFGVEVEYTGWKGDIFRGKVTRLSTGHIHLVDKYGVGFANAIAIAEARLLLRPFSALCEPLEDGTVPAVEIGKKMYSGSNRAEIVEHFDYKGRACVIKGPGTEVSISEHGFNNGTLASGLAELLREWHFACQVAGKQLIEGVDYIPKTSSAAPIDKNTAL